MALALSVGWQHVLAHRLGLLPVLPAFEAVVHRLALGLPGLPAGAASELAAPGLGPSQVIACHVLELSVAEGVVIAFALARQVIIMKARVLHHRRAPEGVGVGLGILLLALLVLSVEVEEELLKHALDTIRRVLQRIGHGSSPL